MGRGERALIEQPEGVLVRVKEADQLPPSQGNNSPLRAASHAPLSRKTPLLRRKEVGVDPFYTDLKQVLNQSLYLELGEPRVNIKCVLPFLHQPDRLFSQDGGS